MNKNDSGVKREGRTETVDVSKVKVSRPSNSINMGGEREGAIVDDTQTLNLKGGGDEGIINGNREILRFV